MHSVRERNTWARNDLMRNKFKECRPWNTFLAPSLITCVKKRLSGTHVSDLMYLSTVLANAQSMKRCGEYLWILVCGSLCTSTKMEVNPNVLFESWMLNRSKKFSPLCAIGSRVFKKVNCLVYRTTWIGTWSPQKPCSLLDHGIHWQLQAKVCVSSRILFYVLEESSNGTGHFSAWWKTLTKIRFEHCLNRWGQVKFLRLLQCHSGEVRVVPKLQNHVQIPHGWTDLFITDQLAIVVPLSTQIYSLEEKVTTREDTHASLQRLQRQSTLWKRKTSNGSIQDELEKAPRRSLLVRSDTCARWRNGTFAD